MFRFVFLCITLYYFVLLCITLYYFVLVSIAWQKETQTKSVLVLEWRNDWPSSTQGSKVFFSISFNKLTRNLEGSNLEDQNVLEERGRPDTH